MTSYIEERLRHAPDERIEYLTHLSLWAFVPQGSTAIASLGSAVAIVLLMPPDGAYGDYALVLSLVPAVIGVIVIARALITFYSTEIGVTSRRVMLKTGWIARNTPEMKLEKIEMQELRQSGAGRLLGFGTLHVRAAGDENLIIRSVDQPLVLADVITTAMDARNAHLERARPRAPTPVVDAA